FTLKCTKRFRFASDLLARQQNDVNDTYEEMKGEKKRFQGKNEANLYYV
ncbi:unnamed protein product, partial [Tenebrio molitor]